MTVFCNCCDGHGVLLGILGRLAWFRCRHCGAEFSIPAADLEEEL